MSRRSMQALSPPAKPSPDFPLFAHQSGKWAKKIKGRTLYFGRWDSPDAALAEYQRFLSGDTNPPATVSCGKPDPKILTLYNACNLFLDAKESQAAAHENSARTYRDYVRTCSKLCDHFGKDLPIESLGPLEFSGYRAERSKTCNPVSVGNEVTRVKTMLKWLVKSKIINELDTGPDFRKPSATVARRHRRMRGKMMFSSSQIKAILDESGVQLRAMVLLGINCGFQNSDLETMSLCQATQAIETGWLDFPRQKTEVERRCHVWKKTRKAMQEALARRPQSGLSQAFLLPDGRPYSASNGDIAKRFRAARDHALIRVGGFSWLRKTFETVGSSSKDQVAVNFVMGHVDPSMAAVYRQEILDDRLLAVSRVVYRWLFR